MPRFPSAQGRLNHEPDSTLAVTKTCPKDGVHLFEPAILHGVQHLASFVLRDIHHVYRCRPTHRPKVVTCTVTQ